MKARKIVKTILLVSLVVLFVTVLVALLKFFTGYKVYKNVEYFTGEANVMDIYLPSSVKGEENLGAVLFIHGGSWSGGDKKEEDFRCRLLASHGYITATMNYTLYKEQSEYSVFAVLDEIDLALLKLKSFAGEKEAKIEKIAISGYSAGAHLAMLYGYSRTESAPVEISFIATMAGPAEITADVWGEDMTARIATLLSGNSVSKEAVISGEAGEILKSISPTTYISKNSPPTLIIHGGKDDVVPIKNAQSVIDKLKENEISYDYFYLENFNHLLIQNPFKHLDFLKTFINYCKKYFN